MSPSRASSSLRFFFFNDPAPTEIYPLSLHDALPIFPWSTFSATASRRAQHPVRAMRARQHPRPARGVALVSRRSEEHTSELQSPCNLVCRLLLEKKKKAYPQYVPPLHDLSPNAALTH